MCRDARRVKFEDYFANLKFLGIPPCSNDDESSAGTESSTPTSKEVGWDKAGIDYDSDLRMKGAASKRLRRS